LLAGCDKGPAEPAGRDPATQQPKSPSPSPNDGASDTPAQAPPAAGADIGWRKPDAWEDVQNPSPMRKATYKIPRAEGDKEDGELSVTTAGGSVDANITRWEGQFDGSPKAKRSDKEVDGIKVAIVELSGTYKGGGPMMGGSAEPKPDYMMLAAIAETSPQLYFFKLTGPKKTVEAARGDFDVLVGSIAKK
jgi:hypothetical protein